MVTNGENGLNSKFSTACCQFSFGRHFVPDRSMYLTFTERAQKTNVHFSQKVFSTCNKYPINHRLFWNNSSEKWAKNVWICFFHTRTKNQIQSFSRRLGAKSEAHNIQNTSQFMDTFLQTVRRVSLIGTSLIISCIIAFCKHVSCHLISDLCCALSLVSFSSSLAWYLLSLFHNSTSFKYLISNDIFCHFY